MRVVRVLLAFGLVPTLAVAEFVLKTGDVWVVGGAIGLTAMLLVRERGEQEGDSSDPDDPELDDASPTSLGDGFTGRIGQATRSAQVNRFPWVVGHKLV